MSKQYRLYENLPQHKCISWKEGGTIIFKCNSCSYIRKWEVQSGKFILENAGDPMALHEGAHQEMSDSLVAINEN